MHNTFLYSTADNDIGFKAGEEEHTLALNEIPSHSGHLLKNEGYNHSGNANAKYLSITALTTNDNLGNIGCGWNDTGGGGAYPAGVSRGGSLPHNNMPPYTVIRYWRRIS